MAVLLCADDFGMSPSINDGILELLKNKKISAVSCMTNKFFWRQDAFFLIPFLGEAKIGLHFNIPYHNLYIFIIRAYLGIISRKKIEGYLQDQYEEFVCRLGRKPDFIDGHEHIHQLPVVRDVVIAFYQKNYTKDGFIRNTFNLQKGCIKAKIINFLGAKRLRNLLQVNAIPHNKNFSGIYCLKKNTDYRELLKGFLGDISGDGLIMCHPALSDLQKKEKFRNNEFNALSNFYEIS